MFLAFIIAFVFSEYYHRLGRDEARLQPYMRGKRSSRTLSHSMTVFCLWLAFLTLGQIQRAAAQMNMSAATAGTQDQVPPNQLPAPQKMSGIGNVHMQIRAT